MQNSRSDKKHTGVGKVTYQTLYDHAPDMYLSVDPYSKRIIVCNKRLALKTGFKKKELIGQPIEKLYHPDCKKAVKDAIEDFIKKKKIENLELILCGKKGEEIPVLLNSEAIYDDDGKLLCSNTCLRDISEMKYEQSKLLMSKEVLEREVRKRTNELIRYKQAIEQVQDYAIFLLDPKGYILNWNKGAENIKGYTDKEIIGKHFSCFYTPKDIKNNKPQKLLKTALETGHASDESLRIRKDGSLFWGSIIITPVYNDNNVLRGFSKVTRDLTERKRAEETLKKSSQQLKSILESASDAIITSDTNGKIITWNKAAEKLFGWSIDEICDKSIQLIMPEKYWTMFKTGRSRYFKAEKSKLIGNVVEVEGLHKNGTVFPVEISLSTWKVDNKHYFSGILRDIRERKEAEEAEQMYKNQLELINTELEQFVYIASHDLQEPLRTVKSFVELIQRRYEDKLDEKGLKSMQYITNATDRMSNLIKGLLDYSRIGMKGEVEEIDLTILLQSVKDDLHTMIQDNNAILVTKDLPTVFGYKTELRLLFQNLIANAIKFRKDDIDPKIQISAKKLDNDTWKIDVKDNGIGIAKEHQEKIFKIFQRLHVRSKYEGTGIGLSHCQKIVELHGGKISVSSKPDKGSTFSFTLSQKALSSLNNTQG